MRRWRIHFKSKEGDQVMTLLADTREKAEQEAIRAQARRHDRFPLTFARLEASLTGDALKTEMEKRRMDLARYDEARLKIAKIEEVK